MSVVQAEERRVWGDGAYQGQTQVIRECAPRAQDYRQRRCRYNKGQIRDEVAWAKNRTKSKVRAKVEHVFQVMKLKFGFVKVRYRGLKKNAHRLFVTCGQLVCKPQETAAGGVGSSIFAWPKRSQNGGTKQVPESESRTGSSIS
jgi:IS5 family transposase